MRTAASLISLVVAMTFTSGCSHHKEAPKAALYQPIGQLIQPIIVGSEHRTHPYLGKVDSVNQINLAFKVAGQLAEFPVQEGEAVKKGQLLARLHANDYPKKILQAQASYDRVAKLLEKHPKKMPANELLAEALDDQHSQLGLSKAALEHLQQAYADTFLYAPADGVITKRHLNNQEKVAENMPIVTLQNNQGATIQIQLPESEMLSLGGVTQLMEMKKRGTVVGYAKLSTIPNELFPVTIKECSPNTPQGYTLLLSMTKPQADLDLGTAQVSVYLQALSSNEVYFLVPRTAVKTNVNGDHFVWVVDAETLHVHKRAVDISTARGKNIKVIRGINMGEMIAMMDNDTLIEDAKVRLNTMLTSN